MIRFSEQKYMVTQSSVIFKTRGEFGELSNFSSEFPLDVNGDLFYTSEALYQSLKFPEFPDLIEKIRSHKNPYLSKQVAVKSNYCVRLDWQDVNLDLMKGVLELKYKQHKTTLDKVLDSTENTTIVEKSFRDSFWGAVPYDDSILIGRNILGHLWMQIRDTR
jgi:ribA/ribD-fused uncharacterized protein